MPRQISILLSSLVIFGLIQLDCQLPVVDLATDPSG